MSLKRARPEEEAEAQEACPSGLQRPATPPAGAAPLAKRARVRVRTVIQTLLTRYFGRSTAAAAEAVAMQQ